MDKPVVVVPGLVRKDAVAYLSEHVTVRQWTEKEKMPKEVLKEWLRDADGLWSINHFTVDEDLVKDAPNLKVIAQASVGYDNIDVDALTARHIPYGNTPDVLTETTAELAFTLMAAASRRIYENAQFVKDGKWAERPSNIKGKDLSRMTLGIIGMGKIGVSVSRRARAFGMTVQYHNRNRRNDDSLLMTTYVSLGKLLTTSDVILVKALETGQIDYAALDVVDPEPIGADHPLLKTGKCLVVPHIGSFTDRTRKDMAMLTANNLIAGVHGKPLLTCVNESVNYKATEE